MYEPKEQENEPSSKQEWQRFLVDEAETMKCPKAQENKPRSKREWQSLLTDEAETKKWSVTTL